MEIGNIDQALAALPRLKLSELPTPVTHLARLSRELDHQIYCKRDDLTGFAFGGNKSRKLEFLLANARQANVDTLVTVGGIQSNFCRMAAAAATRIGLECHLILGGQIPSSVTGNMLLDTILGAKVELCDSLDWVEWEETANLVASELRSRGRNVYQMPIGGSTAIGTLGYVAAFAEIARDAQRLGTHFDHIVLASSSGGTQAGLIVGKALAEFDCAVHGISVVGDKVVVANDVFSLARATAKMLGTQVSARDVLIDDDFVGEGYAIPTEAGMKAIEIFARHEGIFLDRVYTGKAAAGLLAYLQGGRFKTGESVLFLHTGGTPELFAEHT